MLRKKITRQSSLKKLFPFKKKPLFVRKRQRLAKKRRLHASLNRLYRAQLRALRPVYCRVYRARRTASPLHPARFVVIRTARISPLRSGVVQRFLGLRTCFDRKSLLRNCLTRASIAFINRQPRGARQPQHKPRLSLRPVRGGLRARLSLRKLPQQQKNISFSTRRTTQAYRSVRRLSARTLRSKLLDTRSRAALNYRTRLVYTATLLRRSSVVRFRPRRHREKRLRIRKRRFRSRRMRRLRHMRRRARSLGKKLSLRKRARSRRIIRGRNRRSLSRQLSLRTAQFILGAVAAQRRRHRNRVSARIFFSKNRSLSARALPALKYRLARSNPKGWFGPRWRRRRRGRRMFAGVFGKRRYRLERRDKGLFKRSVRRLGVRRGAISRTIRVNAANALLQLQQQRVLRGGLHIIARKSPLPAYVSSIRGALRRVLAFHERRRAATIRSHAPHGRFSARAKVAVTSFREISVTRHHNKCRRVLPLIARFANLRNRQASKVGSSKYRAWQKQAVLLKRARQQRLRSGAVSALASYATRSPLLARQLLRKYSANTYLNSAAAAASCEGLGLNSITAQLHRNQFFTASELKPAALAQVATIASGRSFYTGGLRRKVRITAPSSFLLRGDYSGSSQLRPNSQYLQLNLASRLQRAYRARRVQHRRPKLRLPATTVNRNRSRRGGLGLFMQRTLKQPRSVRGLSNLFLPPADAFPAITSTYSIKPGVHRVLLPSVQHDDDKPRFRLRPPTRANMKAVHTLRLRRLQQLRRRAVTLHKLRSRGRQLVPQLRSISPMLGTTTPASVLRGASTQQNVLLRLTAYNTTATRARVRSRTAVARRAAMSSTVSSDVLSKTKALTSQQKTQSLWHYASVRNMLRLERNLCAWSPQLSTRKRRWSYPRVNGAPLPRKRVSFKAERERIRQNANLLLRNLPQRKYVDYGHSKLQFYYGSPGTTGFKRIRRVHRPHTAFSRWWYPSKHSVPFAHPFSRRALSAKQYSRRYLLQANSTVRTGLNGAMSRLQCKTREHKFPARAIPWRNFHFRRPRRGNAPTTLQRWTTKRFVGRTPTAQLGSVPLILKRTPREVRALEGFFSSHRVWGRRSWSTLDSALSRTAVDQIFAAALGRIPSTAWTALRKNALSSEKYAVAQHQLLLQFRRWVLKQQLGGSSNAELITRAQRFVLRTLTLMLSGARTVVATTQQVYHQHKELRDSAFSRKVSTKRARFMSLRELPRIESQAKAVNNPTALRQSLFKKHWLRGAERLLQRSQLGYTPPSRSRYTSSASVAFGRRRVRFPASGRRKGSYDSLLHAFVKRTSAARFRRVSPLKFTRVAPQECADFRWNLLTTSVDCGTSRRRLLAQKLSGTTYLSGVWRKLFAYRNAVATQAPSVSSFEKAKRRFASLPVNAVFAAAQTIVSGRGALSAHPMHAVRAGVLRRALRRRRDDRSFADLYKAALSRKTPRDQPASAGKLRRAARRKLSGRAGPWSQRGLLTKAPTKISWTLRHLSATGPRIENIAPRPLAVLPSGELLQPLVVGAARRNRRAFRGFAIVASTKSAIKLRRKKRDSRKRHRGYKRRRVFGVRAIMCRIRHWSEKKSSRRLLHYSLQKRRAYALRFTRVLRSAISASTRKNLRLFPVALSEHKVHSFTHTPHVSGSLAVLDAPAAGHFAYAQYAARTSVRRAPRRSRLRRKSRLLRLRYRNGSNRALNAKTALKVKRKRVSAVRSSHPRIAGRLVATTTAIPAVAPLFFQHPTGVAVKSSGAKNKAILANITSKESRYKITAQYAESLLEFIPAFISQMLSKKIKVNGESINYKTAQHLVRNIYWSLRVYLNVDPFDNRFELREQRPAARVQLGEAITNLAASQRTEQPQRAILRHRFQPGRIPLAANTKRFRGDWLRAFFPEKHALYQEDAEDYGLFLFRTRDIRRLRIGGGGMPSWRTTYAGVSHETRARQALTLRFSRATPRFETLLQTLRRTPQVERGPVADRYRARESFFVRHHSTYAYRRVALSTRWIHRRKRFVAVDSKWRTVAPVSAASSRRSVLVRLEARGRTRYVSGTKSAVSTSLLDSRFTRSKSPRSRQYVLRMPPAVSQNSRLLQFAQLRTLRALSSRFAPASSLPTSRWTRRYRRSKFAAIVGLSQIMQQTSRQGYQAASAYRLRTTLQLGQRLNQRRGTLHDVLARCVSPNRHSIAAHKRSKVLLPATIRVTGHVRRRVKRCTERLRPGVSTLSLLPIRRRVGIPIKKLQAGLIANQFPGLVHFRRARTAAPAVSAVGAKLFKSRAGLQLLRRFNFATVCAKRTRQRRQTPFDSYRPRLWKKLTLRWMKKFRIGRYWVRDTTRWLRDPWLSQIVACDMSLRPDRTGGELRSRDQQIGEYVAEVDDMGRDIPEAKAAFRERHPFTPKSADQKAVSSRSGKVATTSASSHRLQISKIARRKPIPAMWLANYEYRDAIREHKEEKAKSRKQKEEEDQTRVKEYWARKAANLPEEKPRRAPLKHPANLWLPKIIWSEIQRRVRKFEWRESDEVFFRRGFRNAFRFYPGERNRAPWLEHLMYTRATYSTRLHEFRRWQYPREQKKYKWLQRVRKTLYPNKLVRYIKGRRWPQLKRYNQKLHYTLFNLPDRSAARRHFKKLSRRSRPDVSGFVSASSGLTNRLDGTLMQLGVAPSIYWARIVAKFCLLRVNGVRTSNPAYLLQPGDILQPEWDSIARFQHYFKPQLSRREAYQRRNRTSTSFYPQSMEYHRGTRTVIYKHAPDESDLRRSSRLQPNYFRWFKLDSA